MIMDHFRVVGKASRWRWSGVSARKIDNDLSPSLLHDNVVAQKHLFGSNLLQAFAPK